MDVIDKHTQLAADISAAEAEVNTAPTPGQKAAGNYKKGHVRVGTFDVTIEQPVGSVRRGTDADGKEWETTMHNTYGYIRGTEGVDGDHIDVFLSDNIDGWNGRRVVVVDQYNPDGTFDEHKVMLGFNDKSDAINAYLANYERGWEKGRRLVFSTATLDDFEKWIESSHRKQKPYHEYKVAGRAEVDMSDEGVTELVSHMKSHAVAVPIVEITEANWREKLDTPLGSVKMGKNQKDKLFAKGREQQYGMLLETLSNPDIVLEEADKDENLFHERPSSYLFIKTFQKADGSKYVHFESVTVSQEGMEVSISSHIIRENQLKQKMKSDRLLYKATALDEPANSSAEQPINEGGSPSSEGKVTTTSTEKQADKRESSVDESEDEILLRAAMSRGAEFAAVQARAVSERGIVMPGLNEARIRVVEVPRHDFAGTGKEALVAAETWAKANITGNHIATDSRGVEFEYSISNDAVEKYVSRSATGKSANIGVHLAALKMLSEIIEESVEAEIHADYKKGYGRRNEKNGINSQSLVHRFYGAVSIDGRIYRVKTTMREYSDVNISATAHSYEVTQIELLEAPSDNTDSTAEPLAMTSNNSIDCAKLLKGVEKSYDPSKKLLDESGESELGRMGDGYGAYSVPLSRGPFNLTVLQESALSEAEDSQMNESEDDNLLMRNGIMQVNDEFNEQLERWTSGEMGGNEVIHAGYPLGVMRQFMPEAPLIMRQKVLTKSRKKHGLTVNEIKGLPGALAKPIFVFKSTPETISVLTELKSTSGNNLFVAVEIGVSKQLGHRVLDVNDILTVHDREIENVVLPITENGSLVWVDKEKGLEWLSSAKSKSQAIAAQTLDDVANIIKSFENPTISEEESLSRQGDGYGAYSDAEAPYANDPVSKVMGKNRFSKKRQTEFAARECQRMVARIQKLAERIYLDNVEVVTEASQLDGMRSKAKGFYNKSQAKSQSE